ncbi:MAG: general secretion pathway protein GspK [Planctomycetes bacterium]|nr:general secretion pathway protein GspK [Planctomycetota bacterium]
MKKTKTKFNTTTAKTGLALVVVLVILVVLASIVYSLSAKIATAEHRKQYFIDYQNAQYAANSAIKYALVNLKNIKPTLIDRTESPDFSDLFTLDKFEYQEMLDEWAIAQTEKLMLELEEFDNSSEEEQNDLLDQFSSLLGLSDNAINLSKEEILLYLEDDIPLIDPNDLQIPGPYGQPWPQIAESVEFEINNAKITIQYEDENAKMPLIWAITTDKKINRQAQAALETFAEWMQMDAEQIEGLALQLDDIAEIKQFTINPKDIVRTTRVPVKTPVTRGRRTSRRTRTTTRTKTIKTTVRSAIGHTTDFAKLLHSPMIDTDALSIPLPNTGKRHETPVKYLALWGSQKVNINTAPRHILEAAFTFGGDAEEIADQIITLRQEKPIKDIKDLETRLYGYNDSIQKTGSFITTTSKYFSIKVTAAAGRAKTVIVATVVKEGNNFKRIAIITQ